MDDWEKFNETTLHEKEDFYGHLNMEDIADVVHAHTKRVCKDFKIRNSGQFDDFYFWSDTLLLTENFKNMFLEIFELDPVHFF